MSASEAAGFSGAVLVARAGEIVLHKGSGFADREREYRSQTDTVFDIGSITKQFTATTILKLEQERKLATGDPLALLRQWLHAEHDW